MNMYTGSQQKPKSKIKQTNQANKQGNRRRLTTSFYL